MHGVLTPIKYVVDPKGCIIPYVNNVKNKRNGRQREAWGSKDTNHRVNMVRMFSEDDYSANMRKKMHKDAYGAKEMKIKLSQKLFNCNDMKGGFDEDRKIGDGICGLNILNQKTRENTGRIIRNPRRSSRNFWKPELNYSFDAEEKSLYEKRPESTK